MTTLSGQGPRCSAATSEAAQAPSTVSLMKIILGDDSQPAEMPVPGCGPHRRSSGLGLTAEGHADHPSRVRPSGSAAPAVVPSAHLTGQFPRLPGRSPRRSACARNTLLAEEREKRQLPNMMKFRLRSRECLEREYTLLSKLCSGARTTAANHRRDVWWLSSGQDGGRGKPPWSQGLTSRVRRVVLSGYSCARISL